MLINYTKMLKIKGKTKKDSSQWPSRPCCHACGRAGPPVDGPYNNLLTVNISAMVALYNEFHACFRC
jgi:hypothetical protein